MVRLWMVKGVYLLGRLERVLNVTRFEKSSDWLGEFGTYGRRCGRRCCVIVVQAS